MGKSTAKKKTPKDVSGGGGKSGKTNHPLDEDMEFFISLAIEHKEGNKLFQKRDHEGARLRYDKAVSLLPKEHIDVAYLRTSIASCYMQMGLYWYPNAISECDLALEASARYSKALLRRSQCNEALNKLDLAFRDARTVLNMEPENASANEIFDKVKKRLVDKGVDVDEMENSFVNVQPVGTARLRKKKKNGGKDDEVKSNTAVESPKVEMGDEAESEIVEGGQGTKEEATVELVHGDDIFQTQLQREDGVEVEGCPICYENVPQQEIFAVFGCFHRVCFACMNQHLICILQERKPLTCPSLDCKSELKPLDCNVFASANQIAMMVERKAEENIEVSDRLYCPNPRCSFLMSARGLSVFDASLPGSRKCEKCGLLFCLNCKMKWRKQMTCAEFQNTKAYKKSGTAVFDATARKLGLKKCRKCHCTVERVEGCKHMTCMVCKHEFCYSCGNAWIKKKPTCRCATRVD